MPSFVPRIPIDTVVVSLVLPFAPLTAAEPEIASSVPPAASPSNEIERFYASRTAQSLQALSSLQSGKLPCSHFLVQIKDLN
jgi:hypothetical protein